MINDLAKITTIPVFSLKKLCTNMILCICHRVLENYLNKETETTADIVITKAEEILVTKVTNTYKELM